MDKARLMISVFSCFLLGGSLATETQGQAPVPLSELLFREAAEKIPFLPAKETETVEPQYTEEARKAHLEGTVSLYVEVVPSGRAENARVLRSLGMGLDEKAVEAVHQWRFQPATRGNQLITAATVVLVDFHLPPHIKMTMTPTSSPLGARQLYRVTPGSDIVAPQIISRVGPSYTQQARDVDRRGVVIL
jgi:TonB family protein